MPPRRIPLMAAAPLENLAQRIAQQQSQLETLRREYQARQDRLVDLERRKKELQSQLQQVEADIDAVTRGNTLQKAPPSRPKASANVKAHQPQTLPDAIVEIVRQAGGPMRVKQITEELVRRKFPTTSGDILNMVSTRVRELLDRAPAQGRRRPGRCSREIVKRPEGCHGQPERAPPAAPARNLSRAKKPDNPSRRSGRLPFEKSWPCCSRRAKNRCRRTNWPGRR